jgi:hypothetical protein
MFLVLLQLLGFAVHTGVIRLINQNIQQLVSSSSPDLSFRITYYHPSQDAAHLASVSFCLGVLSV